MESSFLRPPQMNAYFCRVSTDEAVKSRQIFKQLDLQQKAPQQVVDTTSLQKQQCSVADQHKTGDRLTILHSRLHQEADKIRKWKTATDIELRQKDKQLQDTNHSIEIQKKALFELQIENEALTAKIHEETTLQHEVCKRIEATREMCNALKDHICRIEQVMEVGVNDRMELQKLGRQRYEQYEEIVAKFQTMEDYWADRESTLLTTISNKEALNSSLQTQLSLLSGEIETLKDCLSVNESDSKRMKAQLEMSKGVHEDLEKEIQKLSADLSMQQEEHNHKCDVIKQLESTVCEQLQRLDQFETETAKFRNEAALMSESYCEQYQVLLGKLSIATEEKNELSGSITCLQEKIEAQDIIIHQLQEKFSIACTETQTALEEGNSLKMQLCAKNNEMEEIKLSNSLHVMNLTEKLTILEKEKSSINCSYQQACDEIRCVNGIHANELERINFDLQGAKNEINLYEKKVYALEEELKEVRQESERLCKDLRMLGQDLTSQKAENNDLRVRLDAFAENEVKSSNEIIALKKQLNDREVSYNELLAHVEVDRKMHEDELQSIAEKNTSLNKEVKENQRKLDLLLQSYNDEVGTYRKKLDDLDEVVVRSKAEMKLLEEKSEQELLKVKHEHEIAKQCFDSQVNELCTMLEKYKIENLKIVTQKDREIEALKQRIIEAEALEKEFEDEAVKFQLEKSNLLKSLHEKELQTCKEPYCGLPDSVLAEGLTLPGPHTPKTKCIDATVAAHTTNTPPHMVPSTPRQNVRSCISRGAPIRHHLMEVNSRCNPRSKKQATLSSREVCAISDGAIKPSITAEEMKIAAEHTMNEKQCDKKSGKYVSGKKFQSAPKKKQGRKLHSSCELQDTTWFDLDSVFGFGPND